MLAKVQHFGLFVLKHPGNIMEYGRMKRSEAMVENKSFQSNTGLKFCNDLSNSRKNAQLQEVLNAC